MFTKVLVANRGEIAVRALRAAREIGVRTVAVFPHEDRWSEHRMKAEEAYEIGEVGHPVRAYLDPEAIVAAAVQCGADAVYPGYGFLSENPALAEACAAAGDHLHRPERRGPHADRQQGPRHRRGQGRGRPGPRVGRALHRCRGAAHGCRGPAGQAGRHPALRQGRRRRRRSRHAARRGPRRPARGHRDVHARGGGRLRRPDRLHRAGRGRPAAHRGADPRRRDRRRGRRHPPLRARLLGAAPPPEGRRDRPRPGPRPRAPRPHVRRCGALRPRDRLQERRHRRVPPRPARSLRLHRDEPAHPGRAHGDRGGHRHRPRAVADADRRRRDPRRPRPLPGQHPAARLRAAVPHHHRGPRQRLPPRHREDHDLPLPRRSRRPHRRRHDLHRRRDQPPLRLDAGQAHLSRPHLRGRRPEGPAGAARVPHPRRLHQRRLPPGRARRPRLRCRWRHHLLHRGPPLPAPRPALAATAPRAC